MRDVLRALYWAWPLFAFLLPVVFALQYGFVRFQVSRATDEELKHWASQIRSELRFTDHWEVGAFRRAFLEVPDWTIVLTVRNTLTDAVGRSFADMWQISFESLGDKTVMIIDVEPSREPAFVRGDKGTDFYIRAGNSSRLLDSRDTHNYLRKHRWTLG
jgi:hypothetical protein